MKSHENPVGLLHIPDPPSNSSLWSLVSVKSPGNAPLPEGKKSLKVREFPTSAQIPLQLWLGYLVFHKLLFSPAANSTLGLQDTSLSPGPQAQGQISWQPCLDPALIPSAPAWIPPQSHNSHLDSVLTPQIPALIPPAPALILPWSHQQLP